MEKTSKLPYSTPWGAVQQRKTLAPGIVRVSTAGHGGIYVAPWKHAEMPEPFRAIVGCAGPNWYEEDCDWALVYAAFESQLIKEDSLAHTVVETLRQWHATTFNQEEYFAGYGAALLARATNFYESNSKKFQIGSMGSPSGKHESGDWWGMSATTMDKSRRVSFDVPKYPNFGSTFTMDDMIAAGAIVYSDTQASTEPQAEVKPADFFALLTS